MSNPVQTFTASGRASSVTASAGSPMTIGNRLIVAVYAYIPYPLAASIHVADTTGGNNRYTLAKTISLQSTLGGKLACFVYSAPIVNNAGSPFSVTVSVLNGIPPPPGGLPYFGVACYECSALSGTQPDVVPTSQQQPSGNTTITPSFQTPTVTNDFGVAVMTIDGTSTWVKPSSWTVGIANQNSSQPVNGEADCIQLASGSPVSPVWTTISNSTVGNQGTFVLFRGAGSSLTVSAQLARDGPRLLPPVVLGKGILKPPQAHALARVLPPRIRMPSWFSMPSCSMPRVLPPQITTSGSITIKDKLHRARPVVLPPQITFTQPSIRVKRGPLASLLGTTPLVTLQEGEFYEAGYVQGGTSYTFLFMGGHDGTLKLIGPGCQTVTGMPGWTPPANMVGAMMLWDTTNHVVYFATAGSSWTTIS